MVMMLSILFLGSIQPIVMVMSLMLITFLYSFYVYCVMGSYWFSYALVMVMLSGVFVIFVYMSSLIPNEGFEVYSLIFIVVFSVIFFLSVVIKMSEVELSYITLEMWMLWMGLLVMFLVGFLFSMMLMAVWLSCSESGALRVG